MLFPKEIRNSVSVAVVMLAVLATNSLRAVGQLLTWSSPTEFSSIQVGGQNSRGGVGAALFIGKVYIAYTDNLSNGNLWLTYQTSPTTYAAPRLVVPNGGTVYSKFNPSLAVYKGKLYISWIDNLGKIGFVSTSDGLSFSPEYSDCATLSSGTSVTATDSPGMAVFGNFLYIGYRTSGSQLGVCSIYVDNSLVANNIYSNFSLGESPGLGVFQNHLYVAYKDTTGSNFIYLAESADGSNFSLNSGAAGNHTSSAASIAVHNGVMYIGYRQNSDGDRFYYTYSTDGVNFSSYVLVHWTMGGPPALVNGPDGKLYNIFRQNDSGHYLYTASAP